jgi:dTDP-4-dehydrorhamnose reductase
VPIVHLSTDYVFDGRSSRPYREDDPPAPLSVYGRTKLAGERAVAVATEAAGRGRWLIVRSQWLYGRRGPAFVKVILGRAVTGGPLAVVDDQWGAPTSGRDLAEALLTLIEAEAAGTVHVANDGAATWLVVARVALEARGLSVPVRAISTADVARPAQRPAYAVLDTTRYRDLTGRRMRPWQEALRAFLATGYEEA